MHPCVWSESEKAEIVGNLRGCNDSSVLLLACNFGQRCGMSRGEVAKETRVLLRVPLARDILQALKDRRDHEKIAALFVVIRSRGTAISLLDHGALIIQVQESRSSYFVLFSHECKCLLSY